MPTHKTLVIADLHLGKASHFRKEGIMIPIPKISPDLQSLEMLVDFLQPDTVVFLGDLFHSSLNMEWLALKEFLLRYPDTRFVLTKGNHDILPSSVMEDTAIEVVEEYEIGTRLLFTHTPLSFIQEEKLNISGHIHPGVMIKTKGRQSYRLPCFYYHDQCLLLPAYGKLTGLQILKKTSGAKVYAVLSDEVIELP
ncbi:DNA ligase-associated metallophosphoesterase [Algoriphagus sp. 4150]|nr:DNA ligase-associated metallophosphoesterase [Algoriphagus sp. 4150]